MENPIIKISPLTKDESNHLRGFQSTYFLCIIYMYEFRIENPYIQFRQIANQPVH